MPCMPLRGCHSIVLLPIYTGEAPAYVYVALYLYNDSTNLPLLMLDGGDVKSLRYVLFSVESMHVLISLHHAALLLGFASDHE